LGQFVWRGHPSVLRIHEISTRSNSVRQRSPDARDGPSKRTPPNWLKTNGLEGHGDLDTLANFAFLSKYDNIQISDGDPAQYLEKADTDELRAQWIPTDPRLWAVERFSDFCAARRELLATALNDLLGLQNTPTEEEPLDSDEAPEPEVGAWGEQRLEEVA
jgi:hypothetical protein